MLKQEFQRAFDAWYDCEKTPLHPTNWAARESNNVWIVVGSSATDIAALMDAFWDTMRNEGKDSVDSFPENSSILRETSRETPGGMSQDMPVESICWSVRPNSQELKQQLKQQLETHPEDLTSESAGESSLAEGGDRKLRFIASLEQCFLRSVDGLAGIHYLKERLDDRSQFWIIGVGQVAWTYLQAVCALGDYGDRVTYLPALSGSQLNPWLGNVVSDLNLSFDSLPLDASWIDQKLDRQAQYFKALADASEGIDTVAIQIFLDSLEVQNLEAQSFGVKTSETKQESFETNLETTLETTLETAASAVSRPPFPKITATFPRCPSLPDLQGEPDIYALYSLLLHQQLSELQLAESLGLHLEQTQSCLQRLAQAGLLEQRGSLLRLSPIYYPAVRSKLKGEIFLL